MGPVPREGEEVIILRGKEAGRRGRVLALHNGTLTLVLASGRTMTVETWKVVGAGQSEAFKTPYDVQRYMSYGGPGQRQGWRDGTVDKHERKYIKRVGGVWYELSVPTGLFVNEVRLSPTTMPRGPGAPSPSDEEAWHAAFRRLSVRLPTAGLTMAAVEDKIEQLVADYKQIAGGRRQRDTTGWRYHSRQTGELYEGEAAVAAWKKDVEDILQREIDAAGRHGSDWTTEVLVEDVLDNYRCQLDMASREKMARMIRTILDAMARAGKIEKDTNERNNPKWLSKAFVPKARL